LIGVWRAGKHHQALEIAVAHEGEEVVADSRSRGGPCSEGGLVLQKEWRCDTDHVAAEGVKGTRVLRNGDLVDAKSVGVRLGDTDISIGSEQTVRVVYGNVCDGCLLELAGLEFLSDQRADRSTGVVETRDVEDCAANSRIDKQVE
jgi:hypothetical protein